MQEEIDDDHPKCCNKPMLWTSYNMEMPKNKGKVDHWMCGECKQKLFKPRVVDDEEELKDIDEFLKKVIDEI